MEVADELVMQLQTLINILSQGGPSFVNNIDKKEKAKKDDKKPREVVTKDQGVMVDSLSDSVKKFFTGLFKFEQPDVKKEMQKKSSWWLDVLILLGASLYALWLYYKKHIYPILKDFEMLFKKDGLIDKFLVGLKRLFSEDGPLKGAMNSIEDFLRDLKSKFTEQKTLLDDNFPTKKIGEIDIDTEEAAKTSRFFGRGGKLSNYLRSLRVSFNLGKHDWELGKDTSLMGRTSFRLGQLLSKNGILSNVLKGLEPITNKIKFLGRILNKLILPLGILLGLGTGYFAYKKEITTGSKDKTTAVLKGILTTLFNVISFFTFGLLPSAEWFQTSIDNLIKDFKTKDIIKGIEDVVLLLPEGILKTAAWLGNLIDWCFTGTTIHNQIKESIKKWNLSNWLNNLVSSILDPIYNWFFDWEGDFAVEVATELGKLSVDLPIKVSNYIGNLSTVISDTLGKIFTNIIELFSNFDFKKVLEKIPGYETLDKFFSKKSKTKSENPPAKSTAQDYISRPGQPIQQFSAKDTVIGLKEGGPILSQLTASATISKKFGELSLKAMGDQVRTLNDIRDLIEKLVLAGNTKQGNNVFVSNKASNISMGGLTPAGSFRNNYLASI